MTSDRRQEVRRVFMAVADLPAEEQAAALAQACAGDVALRAEVDALLQAEARAGGFMADPTSDVAAAQDEIATIAAAPREQVGEQIGRYKLLEQIGEGGFGTVWAAEQREPVKRRVALKIIKLGMDTKQVIGRFEAERQALAMMDHPNIAKVFDAGSTETGRPFFVMELVKGVPILDYCDTEKLDTKARLDLFMKVCHAIQHAHQKGIIHRDIKPSNVMVTLHDGTPVPKVIDFGIAKATNQELTNKTIYTQHHQMIGTPEYMSPEQAEMSGLDIDTRSDIYALGVLLYELLTGTTPFDSASLMEAGFAEMMRIIREDTPHKPSTRLSSLGETGTRTAEQRRVDLTKLSLLLRGDLDWIVMKCLEKDRTRRYDTANGLAADIQRHLVDEPVLAGPPSAKYRLQKFVKRNRSQVIAAGVVATALVLGAVGTTWGMLWALDERALVTDQAAKASDALRQVTDEFAAAVPRNDDAAPMPLADASAGGEVEALAMTAVNLVRSLDASNKTAERELARASEIDGLIVEMLNSMDPETARRQDTTLLRGILDSAAARLAEGEMLDSLVEAHLHGLVGDVYRRIGENDKSDAHLQLALRIRTEDLGPEHEDTLISANSLVALRIQQSRYVEAESLCVKTLDESKHALGEEHSLTVQLMTNLATLHLWQGRGAEAERLLVRALEISESSLGKGHPDSLRLITNLVGVYGSQGRIDKAHKMCVEALRISEQKLGRENLTTIGLMQNLAAMKVALGEFEEAEPLYRDAVALSRDVMGPDHPFTLKLVQAFAAMYSSQGRYEDAEVLYAESIPLQIEAIGLEARDTLGAVTNLGYIYIRLHRFEEAKHWLSMSLPAKRRVLTTEHPWTLAAMSGLAEAHFRLGERHEALILYEEWVELQATAADRSDADANALNTIAWRLLTGHFEELQDPARALGYAQRACIAEENGSGVNLWMYLDTLALAQHRTGDTAAAIETMKRAIELAPQGRRGEVEVSLEKYEAAIAAETGDTNDDQR